MLSTPTFWLAMQWLSLKTILLAILHLRDSSLLRRPIFDRTGQAIPQRNGFLVLQAGFEFTLLEFRGRCAQRLMPIFPPTKFDCEIPIIQPQIALGILLSSAISSQFYYLEYNKEVEETPNNQTQAKAYKRGPVEKSVTNYWNSCPCQQLCRKRRIEIEHQQRRKCFG